MRTARPVGPEAGDRDPRRGVALFVVLVFCAFLAGVAGAALQAATSGVRAAHVFLEEMQADELGRGAPGAVAFRLAGSDPATQRGGAFSVRLARATLDVDYRSESARVDVNTAPVDLLLALLAAAGADGPALAAAQAAILARRGPAAPPVVSLASLSGPAGAAQVAPAPPVAARYQVPLEAVAEWRLPAGLGERVLPALTVANGTTKVDPILADRLVLAALMNGDGARVDDYVERRQQGFADTDSALALLPVTMRAFAGFADVSAVRALVRVSVGGRFRRRYDMVLDPPAFPGEAPKVLSWAPVF